MECITVRKVSQEIYYINTLRLRKMDAIFADNVLKCIFLNEIV